MSARLDVLAPHLVQQLLGAPDDASSLRVARVLARGERERRAASDIDSEIVAWFGWPSFVGMAGIGAVHDLADAGGHWLRADPVYLRADATRVILFDAASVGLDDAESDALLAHLNAGFAADEMHFERGAAPTRWYVRTTMPMATDAATPRALCGSTVEDSLGALRRAGALNRYMTEAQMLLHSAPVNETRSAAGRAPINSVWFWGGGAAPPARRDASSTVLGDDALLATCAQHAGSVLHADKRMLAEVLRGVTGDVLLLDHVDVVDCDIERFEREVLRPAVAALASGRLTRVVIHDREAELSLTRGARWRLWRRGGQFLHALRAAV